MIPPSKHSNNYVIFVVGGASSGKSDLALTFCGDVQPRAFVATCEPLDEEMTDRIVQHQRARQGQWDTAEVPLHLPEWFQEHGRKYSNVVLDCLTLWLSNLQGNGLSRDDIGTCVQKLLAAIQVVPGKVVLVSNELGMGLVPLDSETRGFRSMAGTVNQQMAHAADEVYFAVSGLPLKIK